MTSHDEAWVYKSHSWDPPNLQEFLRNAPDPEVATDEFEVELVCLDIEGKLEQKPYQITFYPQSFNVGEKNIENSQIRCITMTTGDLSCRSSVILLSCRQKDGIECFFLHQPDPVSTFKILNRFRKLQHDVVPRELPDTPIYDFYVPKVISRCEVEIQNMTTGAVSVKWYILSLDEECLCLFSKDFQTKPKYQVYFQKEAGDHVVEKMAVTHSTNTFNIITKLNCYSMDISNDEVKQAVEAMKTIKPKPKSCFEDLAGTVEYLIYEGKVPSARDVGRSSDTSSFHSYNRDENSAIIESAKQFYRDFKDDLEKAYREGETNPVWRELWTPHDEGLREVLELNLVSQRDARSGGLDPDNIAHFQTNLSMIDDQLFNQEFESAVSSLRSMREVFSECSYPEVRPILADDDYTLLRKLFFYFLKKQST